MKFSIGYNEKEGFLEILKERSDFISSVYFPLPKDLGSSGRPAKQQVGYSEQVETLIKTCTLLQIDTILLLNSTYD